MKRRPLWLVVAAAIAVGVIALADRAPSPGADQASGVRAQVRERKTATDDSALRSAIAERASDRWVTGAGEVDALLPDDTRGDRHQRFILQVGGGATVLVAHNIDLAPRIDGLRQGDRVEFAGEFEWNERGGVVHWTHRDPQGRREGGWLRHAGRTYR